MSTTENRIGEEAILPGRDSHQQDPDDRAPETGDVKRKLFDFGQKEMHVRINILPNRAQPYHTMHHFRRPTFEEEEARERMMPYDTEQAGKVEGRDAVHTDFAEEPANAAFYDRIITAIDGYAFDETVRRFKGHPTNREAAAIKDGLYDDDYKADTKMDGWNPQEFVEVDTEKDGPVLIPVVKLVPGWQKNAAVVGIFNSFIESDMDEIEVFSLGAAREWIVRQEIGGGRNPEDGSIRPPQYVLKYYFREPTEQQRRTFRSKAVNSVSWNTKSGNQRDRRTANLRMINKLFDELIVGVEGGSVGDDAFEVSKPTHLKLIFGNFKKITLGRLFRDLEADLGN